MKNVKKCKKIKSKRKFIKSKRKLIGGRYAKITDIGKPLNGPLNLTFLWGNAFTYCNEQPFRQEF